MNLPNVTLRQVRSAITTVDDIEQPLKGGQKLVFPCKIAGAPYALMLMKPKVTGAPSLSRADALDEVTSRAKRETELMRKCTSPYLVRMGPIDISPVKINGQDLIYFTEEWIEGDDLEIIIKRDGPLPMREVIRLGTNIANALDEIATYDAVHRDIKPKNIRKRASTGDYVLLDMGLALDLTDESLTQTGTWVRTPGYVSPEQVNLAQKRNLDVRSDLFVLGIVLYQAATGKHPFALTGIISDQTTYHILNTIQPRPSEFKPGIPPKFDQVIQRLLHKKVHARYSDCGVLVSALESVPIK